MATNFRNAPVNPMKLGSRGSTRGIIGQVECVCVPTDYVKSSRPVQIWTLFSFPSLLWTCKAQGANGQIKEVRFMASSKYPRAFIRLHVYDYLEIFGRGRLENIGSSVTN